LDEVEFWVLAIKNWDGGKNNGAIFIFVRDFFMHIKCNDQSIEYFQFVILLSQKFHKLPTKFNVELDFEK
jgi:hypothetical protein